MCLNNFNYSDTRDNKLDYQEFESKMNKLKTLKPINLLESRLESTPDEPVRLHENSAEKTPLDYAFSAKPLKVTPSMVRREIYYN